MTFTIPTVETIVSKYEGFEPNTEEQVEAKRQELSKHTKDELIDMIMESMSKQRTDTVQSLAKAILKDEELIAAPYEVIAEAIRQLKPEAKTSAKSIASYVSKKREEWQLPPRIRISK